MFQVLNDGIDQDKGHKGGQGIIGYQKEAGNSGLAGDTVLVEGEVRVPGQASR